MAASDPASFQRHFRAVLGHFATGVAVVTARAQSERRPVGMTIQSFSSLSLDPPLILLCPSRASTTWPHIRATGRLCVNLLAEGQADLARRFARPGGDKYAGIAWSPSPLSGSPILDEALAWIDCAIESEHDGGDHTVAICQVVDLEANHDRRPLVFFQSGYQRLLEAGERALGDVRSVVLSVSNMDRACDYYGRGLGLTPLFRDGDRWAVFSGGDFNLALAGSAQPIQAEMAVNIKVPDVERALARAVAAGGAVAEPPSQGAHEIRGAFRDLDGHLFYVYSPREPEELS
jgi:3-hydroxy-9,10-secoandrosta-1,3,5(10)-triene-9,17-dione monooxygenase reductase component